MLLTRDKNQIANGRRRGGNALSPHRLPRRNGVRKYAFFTTQMMASCSSSLSSLQSEKWAGDNAAQERMRQL